jgi:hypothetical protein
MNVRITGRPAQSPELEDAVGRIGEVAEVRERPEGRGKAYRVTGIPGGDVWLAEANVTEVVEEEEDAA